MRFEAIQRQPFHAPAAAVTGQNDQADRAHCRLEVVGDRDSIPYLLELVRSDADLGLKVACTSSLSKLRVIDATQELLDILYFDSYPQSRREMGMCVARLLEAEVEYIELSRSFYEDPGTALAREVDGIREGISKKIMGREDIAQHLIDAREQFALGQLRQGYRPLLVVINFRGIGGDRPGLPPDPAQFGTRMHEFRPDRMEYLILAIVAMKRCFLSEKCLWKGTVVSSALLGSQPFR